MKNKFALLLLAISITIIFLTGCFFKNSEKNNANISQEKVAFSLMPSNTYYTEAELKKVFNVQNKAHNIDAALKKGEKFVYYKSDIKNFSDEIKFQYDNQSLKSYYNIDGKELRFVWEYSANDSNKLLLNTIKQFELVEIIDGSGLYTYPDWNSVDVGYIDIFWVNNNQSFIANIPKDMLVKNINFAIDFCKDSKELVE